VSWSVISSAAVRSRVATAKGEDGARSVTLETAAEGAVQIEDIAEASSERIPSRIEQKAQREKLGFLFQARPSPVMLNARA
jgi:hypothetical protein